MNLLGDLCPTSLVLQGGFHWAPGLGFRVQAPAFLSKRQRNPAEAKNRFQLPSRLQMNPIFWALLSCGPVLLFSPVSAGQAKPSPSCCLEMYWSVFQSWRANYGLTACRIYFVFPLTGLPLSPLHCVIENWLQLLLLPMFPLFFRLNKGEFSARNSQQGCFSAAEEGRRQLMTQKADQETDENSLSSQMTRSDFLHEQF